MSDDLVKRAREAHQDSPQRIVGSNIFAELADRIEALERERDGNRKVASEYEKRLNDEWRVRIAAEAALAAMTAERDELRHDLAFMLNSRNSWQDACAVARASRDEAEARLVKAVKVLRDIAGFYSENIWAGSVARATLAEMGDTTDE